jgi:4'-phosphopantetheinyl transferase
MRRIKHALPRELLDRADRFVFARDRKCYLTKHWILRRILAAYLRTEASALCMARSAHGRPYLLVAPDQPAIQFSLSDSHGLILIAVSRHRMIGVDVQASTPIDDITLIASQWFTPIERSILSSLPPDSQRTFFYRCWVGKEAAHKALGAGFHLPMQETEIFADTSEMPWLGVTAGKNTLIQKLSLLAFQPEPGFSAAIAVSDPVPRVRWFAADDKWIESSRSGVPVDGLE